MRELVFKNLTSEDKKRRDLYISEIVDKNGMRTVTRRHSVYIVGDQTKTKNTKQVTQHKAQGQIATNKRHVFIFKKRDTKSKKDSFICDVVGNFYAVVKNGVYPVAFKHSFEIDFLFAKNK